MIVRREKYYIKKINKLNDFNYNTQKRKRITYLLLGIIPIFINDELIEGSYERQNIIFI